MANLQSLHQRVARAVVSTAKQFDKETINDGLPWNAIYLGFGGAVAQHLLESSLGIMAPTRYDKPRGKLLDIVSAQSKDGITDYDEKMIRKLIGESKTCDSAIYLGDFRTKTGRSLTCLKQVVHDLSPKLEVKTMAFFDPTKVADICGSSEPLEDAEWHALRWVADLAPYRSKKVSAVSSIHSTPKGFVPIEYNISHEQIAEFGHVPQIKEEIRKTCRTTKINKLI